MPQATNSRRKKRWNNASPTPKRFFSLSEVDQITERLNKREHRTYIKKVCMVCTFVIIRSSCWSTYRRIHPCIWLEHRSFLYSAPHRRSCIEIVLSQSVLSSYPGFLLSSTVKKTTYTTHKTIYILFRRRTYKSFINNKTFFRLASCLYFYFKTNFAVKNSVRKAHNSSLIKQSESWLFCLN